MPPDEAIMDVGTGHRHPRALAGLHALEERPAVTQFDDRFMDRMADAMDRTRISNSAARRIAADAIARGVLVKVPEPKSISNTTAWRRRKAALFRERMMRGQKP
jgi:hypothetical protein